jgi:acetamidase/formamidase
MRAAGLPGNPVTGPILVDGAEPGDRLAVTIHTIEADDLGYFGYWPFIYHLADWFPEPVTDLVTIRDRHVEYTLASAAGPHVVRVPLSPMVGCIGTAPALAVPTTSDAGTFGGNLDTPELGPGATIHLPVSVPGAYLYLGDCHPFQGDGELAGCEMRATVTASVQLLKGRPLPGPGVRIETSTHLVAVGADRPAESAQWLAIRAMIEWLCERHLWSRDDARRFLTLASDVRPGQMQAGPYTMRVIVPKGLLPG